MIDGQMWKTLVYSCILLLVTTSISALPQNNSVIHEELNNRPIIAVLAQLPSHGTTSSYIAASYVKYLESAGARVVPIPHYLSSDEVEEIFSYVNGVLFPGGGTKWFTSQFYKHAKTFWNLAIEANDNGDYFPIWGTCLGFETLHVLQANSADVLSTRKADDISYPLVYTDEAAGSRLFSDMSKKLFLAIGSEKLTYNHHNKGVAPETYDSNPSLSKFFQILSTNHDVDNKEFISTVEAFEYPIYGTQWHPEKNNFEFTTLYNGIPHSSTAVKTSQYMANFFVDEARKSSHHFPSVKMEEKYLIYKYKPIYSAVKYSNDTLAHFEQIYEFS